MSAEIKSYRRENMKEMAIINVITMSMAAAYQLNIGINGVMAAAINGVAMKICNSHISK